MRNEEDDQIGKDERNESLWKVDHTTWKGVNFQDEWWRSPLEEHYTHKIRPKEESIQDSLNTLTKFLFYLKFNV